MKTPKLNLIKFKEPHQPSDKIGKFDKALDILNTVLKPNNAQTELLILKAKILKHKERIAVVYLCLT